VYGLYKSRPHCLRCWLSEPKILIMDRFRTSLKIQDFPDKMKYRHPVLCLGSCFAEHMAQKLTERKFDVLLNPFGIQYNPFSVAQSIQYLLGHGSYEKKDLFFNDGLWHSYDHHGSFSHPSADVVLEKINEAVEKGRKYLQKGKWCIITLGTAYVFIEKEQQRIVANCHKMPGRRFDRKKMKVEEVVRQLQSAIEGIWQQNPSMNFLFTVSPVRHIRDGLVENQRSKAVLLLAVEQLTQTFDKVHYFPSYELLLDDLRDYRFYAPDMIHPTPQAIDYIWEHFSQSLINEVERPLMKEVEKIVRASRHRPLHPEREAHRQFVKLQLKKMEELERQYEFLDFGLEKRQYSH